MSNPMQHAEWLSRDYLRHVLFFEDGRVANAPLLPGIMDHETWKQGLQAIEAGAIVECTEDVYDHFLGCVPPAAMNHSGFLCGEAAASLKDGRAVYTAGTGTHSYLNKTRYFLQQCTREQFLNRSAFKSLVPQLNSQKQNG